MKLSIVIILQKDKMVGKSKIIEKRNESFKKLAHLKKINKETEEPSPCITIKIGLRRRSRFRRLFLL